MSNENREQSNKELAISLQVWETGPSVTAETLILDANNDSVDDEEEDNGP